MEKFISKKHENCHAWIFLPEREQSSSPNAATKHQPLTN
jgi:hypothetical protein